ncbi:hypothetical protein KCP69_15715 [Salmonella enterica subsp. enterica]|nr:hypothetical protein KCP69_15715 [Salmonella enterica subsp. enterica]
MRNLKSGDTATANVTPGNSLIPGLHRQKALVSARDTRGARSTDVFENQKNRQLSVCGTDNRMPDHDDKGQIGAQ